MLLLSPLPLLPFCPVISRSVETRVCSNLAGGGDNGFASVGREPDHAVDQPVEFDQDVRLRGVEVGMNGPG